MLPIGIALRFPSSSRISYCTLYQTSSYKDPTKLRTLKSSKTHAHLHHHHSQDMHDMVMYGKITYTIMYGKLELKVGLWIDASVNIFSHMHVDSFVRRKGGFLWDKWSPSCTSLTYSHENLMWYSATIMFSRKKRFSITDNYDVEMKVGIPNCIWFVTGELERIFCTMAWRQKTLTTEDIFLLICHVEAV